MVSIPDRLEMGQFWFKISSNRNRWFLTQNCGGISTFDRLPHVVLTKHLYLFLHILLVLELAYHINS